MSEPEQRPILKIERLSYQYPSGPQALRDISLEIMDGERVGLVGPSGAGKSTLLLHLNGLLPQAPLNGDSTLSPVEVAGLAMRTENFPEIRRQVGFLFQDPDDQLFCPTVRDDVAFGPLNLGLSRPEVEQRIQESLEAVGLSGYESRSPVRLSVGERKRVCLATVLACRPSILALDEPSSSLDPRARRMLLAHLRNFAGAQVIATHDLDLVLEHCSRVIVLDEGRIHADGLPEHVLSRPTLMEQHGLEVPLRLRLRTS